MILNLDPFEVKHRIAKPVDDPERLENQLQYARNSLGASLRATYFEDATGGQPSEPFALLHGERTLEEA